MLNIKEFQQVKKEYLGKSTLTSGNAYKCVFKWQKHRFTIQFNDNYLNNSNVADWVACSFGDALAFYDSRDIGDFLIEYGYTENHESITKGIKAYKECKKQYNRFIKYFTIDDMAEIYGNY